MSGRAGPIHHGYRLYHEKETFVLFYKHHRKYQKFLIFHVVLISNKTVERSSRLRARSARNSFLVSFTIFVNISTQTRDSVTQEIPL